MSIPLLLRRSQWAVAGLLAAVTMVSCWIAYQPSQLYFFGDTWDILTNLVEGGLPAIWRPHNEHVVPIPKFLLYLQYVLFGMHNYPYQVVNILIHAVNTVLLYLFSGRFAFNTVARVFGVLFFSLSGVYLEVTTWETTQQISLAVLFLLLSLILFDTYIQKRQRRWLVWCFMSACGASLSMGFGLLISPIAGLRCGGLWWSENGAKGIALADRFIGLGSVTCIRSAAYRAGTCGRVRAADYFTQPRLCARHGCLGLYWCMAGYDCSQLFASRAFDPGAGFFLSGRDMRQAATPGSYTAADAARRLDSGSVPSDRVGTAAGWDNLRSVKSLPVPAHGGAGPGA